MPIVIIGIDNGRDADCDFDCEKLGMGKRIGSEL